MIHLAEAGTTITANPDQAKRLRDAYSGLECLLNVSETEKSSIDEKEVDLSVVGTAELETKPKLRKSRKAITEDSEEEASAEAELEDDKLDEVDARLLGKFVELSDLLPPLPKKGTFDVETIKGSQYFFS